LKIYIQHQNGYDSRRFSAYGSKLSTTLHISSPHITNAHTGETFFHRLNIGKSKKNISFFLPFKVANQLPAAQPMA